MIGDVFDSPWKVLVVAVIVIILVIFLIFARMFARGRR